MKWISVKDELPTKRPLRFQNLLVAKENKVVMEALYNTKTEKFVSWENFEALNHKVTHWQHLPKAPE